MSATIELILFTGGLLAPIGSIIAIWLGADIEDAIIPTLAFYAIGGIVYVLI